MNQRFFRFIVSFLLVGVLQGCATHAQNLKKSLGNRATIDTIATDHFPLFSVTPTGVGKQKRLAVFIEGDGKAWANASQPSTDPSPRQYNMVHAALRYGQAVYLARPCQFIQARGCNSSIWTTKRFSRPIVNSFHQALDKLAVKHGVDSFDLVGFSGGAYIAAVLAAERKDVATVQTLAGNLDPHAWVKHHALSALDVAQPFDGFGSLRYLPQRHVAGVRDGVVPGHLTYRWIQKEKLMCAALEERNASHRKGWESVKIWRPDEWPHCQQSN